MQRSVELRHVKQSRFTQGTLLDYKPGWRFKLQVKCNLVTASAGSAARDRRSNFTVWRFVLNVLLWIPASALTGQTLPIDSKQTASFHLVPVSNWHSLLQHFCRLLLSTQAAVAITGTLAALCKLSSVWTPALLCSALPCQH